MWFLFSLWSLKGRWLVCLRTSEIRGLTSSSESNLSVWTWVGAMQVKSASLTLTNHVPNIKSRWRLLVHTTHSPAESGTHLNEEDAGCWCWVVIHINCHQNGCCYNDDQDQDSNNEAGVEASSFLLSCAVVCRGWKKIPVVRSVICVPLNSIFFCGKFVYASK